MKNIFKILCGVFIAFFVIASLGCGNFTLVFTDDEDFTIDSEIIVEKIITRDEVASEYLETSEGKSILALVNATSADGTFDNETFTLKSQKEVSFHSYETAVTLFDAFSTEKELCYNEASRTLLVQKKGTCASAQDIVFTLILYNGEPNPASEADLNKVDNSGGISMTIKDMFQTNITGGTSLGKWTDNKFTLTQEEFDLTFINNGKPPMSVTEMIDSLTSPSFFGYKKVNDNTISNDLATLPPVSSDIAFTFRVINGASDATEEELDELKETNEIGADGNPTGNMVNIPIRDTLHMMISFNEGVWDSNMLVLTQPQFDSILPDINKISNPHGVTITTVEDYVNALVDPASYSGSGPIPYAKVNESTVSFDLAIAFP